MRKPFFRKQTNCWYVKDSSGGFIRLDPDEEKAFAMWRKLIDLSNFRHADTSIEALCEGWLDEFQYKLSPDRYERHVYLLQSFAEFVGVETRARDLSSGDVERWMAAERTRNGKTYRWGLARKREAGQAVLRVYRTACNRSWVPMNDILNLRFEAPEPRDTLVTRDIHEQMVRGCEARSESRAFKTFLIALWHSGSRPIAIRTVTAQHLDANGDWVFSSHKTKKKTRRKLVVRTSPCLATLTRILAYHRPTGPLFLSSRGEAWKKDAVTRRITRMRARLKIEAYFTAYSYRHTFATDALLNGLNPSTVAELLGHSSAETVMRVYSHIGKHNEPMKQAANKAAAMRVSKAE